MLTSSSAAAALACRDDPGAQRHCWSRPGADGRCAALEDSRIHPRGGSCRIKYRRIVSSMARSIASSDSGSLRLGVRRARPMWPSLIVMTAAHDPSVRASLGAAGALRTRATSRCRSEGRECRRAPRSCTGRSPTEEADRAGGWEGFESVGARRGGSLRLAADCSGVGRCSTMSLENQFSSDTSRASRRAGLCRQRNALRHVIVSSQVLKLASWRKCGSFRNASKNASCITSSASVALPNAASAARYTA